jgi:hypothetical protein
MNRATIPSMDDKLNNHHKKISLDEKATCLLFLLLSEACFDD